MKVLPEELFDACALHVLLTATSPLTPEEIIDKAKCLSEEEQLDALCRYQENDPEA